MVTHVTQIVFTAISSYGQGTLAAASFVFEKERWKDYRLHIPLYPATEPFYCCSHAANKTHIQTTPSSLQRNQNQEKPQRVPHKPQKTK